MLGVALESSRLNMLGYRLAVVLVVVDRRKGTAKARAPTSSNGNNEPARGIKKYI